MNPGPPCSRARSFLTHSPSCCQLYRPAQGSLLQITTVFMKKYYCVWQQRRPNTPTPPRHLAEGLCVRAVDIDAHTELSRQQPTAASTDTQSSAA